VKNFLIRSSRLHLSSWARRWLQFTGGPLGWRMKWKKLKGGLESTQSLQSVFWFWVNRRKRLWIVASLPLTKQRCLDLIADDQGTLVFIEVKARRGNQFGGAPYAITTRKKQQIIKLALCYLSQHGLTNKQCRFDVILAVETNGHTPQLTHIEQAFEVSSSDWQW